MVETLQETMLAWMRDRSEHVSRDFLRYVRPIYGTDESANPVPMAIGTCVLIERGDDKYLVTAAHVADHERETSLYVGAAGKLIALPKGFYCTVPPDGDRGKDHLDFAFIRLDAMVLEQMAGAEFLGADQISDNSSDPTKRSYLAMGYPISLNKKIRAADLSVLSKAWQYQSIGVQPDAVTLSTLKCNLKHNLFLRIDKKVGNYQGQIVDLGEPRGSSGGALIDLGMPTLESFDPKFPKVGRLAGILIERKKKEKLLVFANIQLVLYAIDRSRAEGGDIVNL